MDTTAEFNGKTSSVSQSEKLLYSQFRRKINAEAARAQIKKLEYDLADVKSGLSVLKNACADANSLELGAICVLPCFVRNCAVMLGMQRKCSLVACISSPHGGDATPHNSKTSDKGILKFTNKELNAMPEEIKKILKQNDHIRQKENGVYEIRLTFNGNKYTD